jgi:purine-binding chemotaxis protein CheW
MLQPGQTLTDPDGTLGVAGTALIFRAGPLYCALPLGEVIETMRPLPVQPLAGTGSIVRGVCVMRGASTPVIDVAQLLGGHAASASRFIAVRTDRGPVALATGDVLGIRTVEDAGAARQRASALGGAAMRMVSAVGTFHGEPLLVLQSMGVLADEIWAAAAAPAGPS